MIKDDLGQKIDVLDLVIDVLREHEKRLDDLITRLEIVFDEDTIDKILKVLQQ